MIYSAQSDKQIMLKSVTKYIQALFYVYKNSQA
jgi:hypothetical protein